MGRVQIFSFSTLRLTESLQRFLFFWYWTAIDTETRTVVLEKKDQQQIDATRELPVFLCFNIAVLILWKNTLCSFFPFDGPTHGHWVWVQYQYQNFCNGHLTHRSPVTGKNIISPEILFEGKKPFFFLYRVLGIFLTRDTWQVSSSVLPTQRQFPGTAQSVRLLYFFVPFK